jgi:hypothetical protein
MTTSESVAKYLNDYKNGKISEGEAVVRITHAIVNESHSKIQEFESSDHHTDDGLPISDMYEFDVLLPLAQSIEDE